MTIKKHDVTKMLLAVRAAGLQVTQVEADFTDAGKIVVHVARANLGQLAALNGSGSRDPDHIDAPAISDPVQTVVPT